MTELQEKEIKTFSGAAALLLEVLAVAASIALVIVGIGFADTNSLFIILAILGAVLFICAMVCLNGFTILAPNEAMVYTFFGKYHGTLKKEGFYFINPLCVSVKPAENLELLSARRR